jgi:elongation factor 1-alpha
MKWRIQSVGGECFYFIGVEDNGTPLGIVQWEMEETLRVLHLMSNNLKAELIILDLLKGQEGDIAHIKVRKEFDSFTLDLKVYLLGDEDSGKSTTLGVLVSGKPDNGKGSARNNVFRHPHEFLSGKTSCLSH